MLGGEDEDSLRQPIPNHGVGPIGETGAISVATGGLLAMAAAIGVGRFVYTPIVRR
jgi:hypothetical protein